MPQPVAVQVREDVGLDVGGSRSGFHGAAEIARREATLR